MDDDWDLHAVVRGCAALTTAASNVGQPFSSSSSYSSSTGSIRFQDLFEPPRRAESKKPIPIGADKELHELYKPFIFKSPDSSQISISPPSFPTNTNSPLSVLRDLTASKHQLLIPPQKSQPFSFAKTSPIPTPRSKKRKTHTKRVCHVAAENLSSDVWSWRKYGQKPIKGSPYPRGYYRCSTSKGCLARKQVERNKSDPGMFIVTYTADHNHPMPTHRNSLAGSTRQKTAPSSDDSSAAAAAPAPEKIDGGGSRDDLVEEDEEEDGLSGSRMDDDLEDDFFAGLEDFASPDSGDCSSLDFSWLSSSATTIAGGGG